MAEFTTRYYALSGLKPGDPDTYFRLMTGGRYERWDPEAKAWLHVTSPAARDYYSRAIENGDDCVPINRSDIT